MSIEKLEVEVIKIKERISKLDLEKNDLLSKLIGLEHAINILTIDGGSDSSNSNDQNHLPEVKRIYIFLKEKNTSIHINKIVKFLGHDGNKNKKISVAGSLNSYAKKKKYFKRTAPNTFAALE